MTEEVQTANNSELSLRDRRRASVASTVGTALEYWDFAIYASASGLIFNQLFFPSLNPALGVIASFASYAVGFVVRPLGSMYFGSRGDRFGRRGVLIATVALMGGATTLIGVLPTYQSVGVLAPVLLILLRMVQGFGAGAEQSGATTLMAEMAQPGERGRFAARPFIGIWVGLGMATGIFALISSLPEEILLGWVWRIPFLVSVVLLFVAQYMRIKLPETPDFRNRLEEADQSKVETPIRDVLRRDRRSLLIGVGIRTGETAGSAIFATFALSYLVTSVGLEPWVAPLAVSVASVCAIFTLPLAARLSDRIGRLPVFRALSLFQIVFAFPAFMLLQTGNSIVVCSVTALMVSVGVAGLQGPACAYLTELFPVERRLAGVGMSREISSVLMSGTAPLLASWLVYIAGGGWVLVATYVVVTSAITFIAALCGPETAGPRVLTTEG